MATTARPARSTGRADEMHRYQQALAGVAHLDSPAAEQMMEMAGFTATWHQQNSWLCGGSPVPVVERRT